MVQFKDKKKKQKKRKKRQLKTTLNHRHNETINNLNNNLENLPLLKKQVDQNNLKLNNIDTHNLYFVSRVSKTFPNVNST